MKILQLQKVLKQNKLDGCLLYAEDPNFQYYVQEYLMSGMLFVPKSGKPVIFVHPLEDLKHKFKVVPLTSRKIFKQNVQAKSLGYNPEFTSTRRYFRLRSRFKIKDVESELENIRILKTQQEIQYLKKAAKIADEIMKKLISKLKTFKTESDIKKFLKAEYAKYGVEQSFEPIVASGVGAAVPHYFGDKKLAKGFLIIDMGVKWKGYCSDITRTFYLGKPTKTEIALYNKVLKVQKNCIKMCKKGMRCDVPYDYAKKELGEEFSHGLGHGIGLKIHELPNLKPNNPEKFKENMVFTVEPGWYSIRKKIGIRIEDDVLIKNGKPVIITKTRKDLICV